jgi:F0F1-type ATP synthase beta subunit
VSSNGSRILITGIKVVDLLARYAKGAADLKKSERASSAAVL